jgi:hypothetical protein
MMKSNSAAASTTTLSLDGLAAALLFRAVLPGWPEYWQGTHPGKVWTDGPVVFSCPGGERFSWGGEASAPALRLHFTTVGQAARAFRGQSTLPPWPLRGWWRVGLISRISRLMAAFQRTMDDHTLTNDPVRAQVILGIACRAIPVLAEYDPRSAEVANAGAQGSLLIGISGQPEAWHLDFQQKAVACRREKADGAADARMFFNSPATTLGILDSRLDPMVEIGLGRVLIGGLVPLADKAGFIMNRLDQLQHG